MGRHPLVQELKRDIARLSGLSAPVLILGESGTGKELVARCLHECGPRRDEPMLAVNCGAIAYHLLESELFGSRAGAFTGADRDRTGLFVAAGRGTLFLDEIAELGVDLQVKLLRSLQEREVVPLGDDRPVPWHARLVSATNIDLDEAVRSRRFREDLYYRINVLRLEVPPLRERRSDVPLLVDRFLERHGRASRPTLSREASELLMRYEWPGNVRQLENVVVRALALAAGDEIRAADLPPEILDESAGGEGRFPTYDEMTRQHLVRALFEARGTQTIAARLLGMNRNRLARLIKRYGIDVEAVRKGADPEQ